MKEQSTFNPLAKGRENSLLRGLLVATLVSLMPLLAFAQGGSGNPVTKEAIVRRYGNAPEKRRAAEFLLDNMARHTSAYAPALDTYYDRLTDIFAHDGYPACREKVRECAAALAEEPQGDVKTDAEAMTADLFFQNVDMAFDDWKHGPWAGHLGFDDFCEYLLPYCVGDENVGAWRKEAREAWRSRLDWLAGEDDKAHSAYWAALYMNDQIKHNGFHIDAIPHVGGVGLPYRALKNMHMGECDDYAALATFVMRACGIPVAIDFTPQWPFRSSGHYWNTLLDNSGRNIPFMGGESNPGYPCKAGYVMAKVYRKTFAWQRESLAEQNAGIGERVPETVASPFIKDVSDEYFRGADVALPLNEPQTRGRRFVYLSVFNNQQWIPVAWAKVDGDTAFFRNMGPDIVYLPTYWGAIGAVGIADPVLVRKDRRVEVLAPDKSRRLTLTLDRKFPVFGGVLYYSSSVVGGRFEASNASDFHDAVTCATIGRNPRMRYDSLAVTDRKAYRYWRYVSPREGHCNIAEMAFYGKGGRLEPAAVFSDGRVNQGYEERYAFDHDELTFYESSVADGGWIAADFGKPVAIDKILYSPRGDDNNVVPGHQYRLDYYDGGRPVKGEPVTAAGGSVTFAGVPAHALYILHDLTKGKEERVFTYEDGQVCWH